MRLVVTRTNGRLHLALVDPERRFAGDPELERRLVYARGSTPFDAVLETGAEASAEFRRPDVVRSFSRARPP